MSSIYNDWENSVSDGAPVECYRFVGTFRTYRYTSADEEVVLGGETYVPVASRRNNIRSGVQTDDTLALEIQMPYDTQVVKDYAYAESPPSLTLEVFRVHRGTSFASDFILLWKGKVASFNVDGRMARIRVPSIFSRALQGDVPNAYWQRPCNHVLFDSRCGLSRANFSTLTTVTSVGVAAFNVVDDGFTDGFLVAGEAVVTRTGERRLILSNQANALTVKHPFVDMRVDDEVELTAGCDHSFSTCKAKFNNGVNFGGHPFIPDDNPFQGEL